MQPTANMRPLSLSDKDKLATAYGCALRVITTLLARAGVFLVSLGADGHAVSRGIANLADALTKLQGAVIQIENWVESMANSQKDDQADQVKSEQGEEDDVTSPYTPRRIAKQGQSPCLGPTPAAASPAVPYGVSTPLSGLPHAPPHFTSLFRHEIQNAPLAIRDAPTLFNHMRTVAPIYQTPTRTLGVFTTPMTARVSTPLASTEHSHSIDTLRSVPPLFWRPAPKGHSVKLMVPDSARHRKKLGTSTRDSVS